MLDDANKNTVLSSLTITDLGTMTMSYRPPVSSAVHLVFTAQGIVHSPGSVIIDPGPAVMGYYTTTYQQQNVTTTICDHDNDKYRFGFNGQMKVNEIAGVGNHNSALYWEYDTRLGKRWNIDPVINQSYSSYATFKNNSIWYMDMLGNVVKLYDQAKKEGTDLKGYSTSSDAQVIGDYVVHGVYEKSENGNVAGKLLGYQAYKNGRLDYEFKPGDLKDFKEHKSLYSAAADLYNSGSDNLKHVGIGLVMGDFKAVRKGLADENIAAWKDPVFRTQMFLSVAGSALGFINESDESFLRRAHKIPDDWEAKPTKKNGGTMFKNPRNPNDNVRFMPGNPDGNPAQQQPYVIRQENGRFVDQYGNPLKSGDDVKAHIPYSKFKFK